MSTIATKRDGVRKAVMADIPDIISVAKDSGYEDDFLPDYLPEWLNDSNRHSQGYVCLVDEKIVGFLCLFKVDDGQVGVSRGARIRKEYQRKAVSERIANYMMEQNPHLKTLAFATNFSHDVVKENIKQGIYKFIALKKYSYYDGTKETFRLSESSGLKTMSQTDLAKLFKDKLMYGNIFKEEHLIIDSVPYRPMESNVPLILIPKTTAIVSNLEQPENTLLTFGTHFCLISGEMMCKIDVYGTVNDLFRNHVSAHIRVFLEKIDKELIVLVRCNDMPVTIHTAMEVLGLKRRLTEKYNGESIVATMKLPFKSLISRSKL